MSLTFPTTRNGDIWIPEMHVTKMQFDNLTEEEQCWLVANNHDDDLDDDDFNDGDDG